MGLSTKKSRSSSTENSTSTTTPNVPSFVSAPSANYYGQVGQLNSSPTAFGANANQRAAFTRAGLLSDGGDANVRDTMAGLLGYAPQRVNVGQVAGANLHPYMDPYENEVVSRSLSDLDRFRQSAISGNQSAATMAGAYGGSRHGVADSETNRGFIDQAGLLSSNLRSAGFRNAQSLAGQDIDRRYGADVGNAERDLAGTGVRGDAARSLEAMAAARLANERANIGLLGDLGAQERGIALENDPERARIARLAQIQGLLGIDPRMFTSMTTTGNRSASGLNSESDGGQGLMQAAAQAVAAYFAGSDRRLKRDAIPIGVDKNGVRWWQFNYHTDALGASPRIGVMADELEEIMPEAVVYGPDGYAKVNYAMLGASSP